MNKLLNRFSLATMLAAPLLALSAIGAHAADAYPDKPIRVVVPYAAGGADTYIRPLQPSMQREHKMNLVIDTVTGAGGTIGAAQVKRAAPDGYTLLFCGSGALTIAPVLQGSNLSANDFVPVMNLVSIPYIVAVRKDSPLVKVGALLDYVKTNPGKLTYGTPGVGSAPHLAMEEVANKLGSQVTHVPFSGIATAVQSLLGGHIEAVVGAPSVVMPQVRAGLLVAVALTSKERFSFIPDVPTLAESGLPLDVSTHFGFYAPKGTPDPIVQSLAAAIRQGAADPEFVKAMDLLQNKIELLPGPAFAKALEAESKSFAPIIASLPKQ
ncbi:tripartite tricarboxylate transporter substrate binding protein [soil metagenome]